MNRTTTDDTNTTRDPGRHSCVRYERREDEPLSVTTARALAAYYGDSDVDTATRLYDYIDPEALDALFADTYSGTTRASGRVSFDVPRATVDITPDAVVVCSDYPS